MPSSRNVRRRMAKRLRVPKLHELRYQRALTGAMRELHTRALAYIRPRLGEVAQKKADGATRFDAAISDDFERKVNDLAAELSSSVAPAFTQLATAASKSNARALRTLGLDVRDELGQTLDHIRDLNVVLMKNASKDFADQVRDILSAPDSWGLSIDELAAQLQERADVSESRAALIARDQTSKTSGAINRIRQTNAGISSYVWSGSLDERERDTHLANEGQVFSWNAPPLETGEPGSDVCCRCVGVPVLPGEDDDEESGAPQAPEAAQPDDMPSAGIPDISSLESFGGEVGGENAANEAIATAEEELTATTEFEVQPEAAKPKNAAKAAAGRKGAQRAAERSSEIHGFVQNNLPPELHPLWEREGRFFMQKMGSHAGMDRIEVKALKKQGATRYRQAVAERVSSAFLEHAQLGMEGGGEFAGDVFGASEAKGEAAIAKRERELAESYRAEATARGDLDAHGELTPQGRERVAREEAERTALDTASAEAEAEHESSGFFDDLL